MKRIALALLIGALSLPFNNANLYPRTMIVTEVNTSADTVELTDFTGHMWELDGVEDWIVGDICACIMNSNGTEAIEDDTIVDVKYNGYVSNNHKMAVGSFATTFKDLDGNEYHQFRSYDNSVWWALTAEEIGFTPEANKTYTLLYDNNGTTDCTECAEELECECEVYDDIFIKIIEGGNER